MLDVDARHGGLASFPKLRKHGCRAQRRCSPAPAAFHYWFRYVGELRNSAGLLGDGLDVRGDGGYVVAPPSVHESGNPYKWLHGARATAADWPAELAAETKKRRNGAGKVDEIDPGRETTRRHAHRRRQAETHRADRRRDPADSARAQPALPPPLDEAELESVAHESTIEPDPDTAIRTGPASHAATDRRRARSVRPLALPARPGAGARHLRRDRRKPRRERSTRPG